MLGVAPLLQRYCAASCFLHGQAAGGSSQTAVRALHCFVVCDASTPQCASSRGLRITCERLQACLERTCSAANASTCSASTMLSAAEYRNSIGHRGARSLSVPQIAHAPSSRDATGGSARYHRNKASATRCNRPSACPRAAISSALLRCTIVSRALHGEVRRWCRSNDPLGRPY